MKSIRRLRRDRGLTQEQLAQKIGVDRSYVSKLEHRAVRITDPDMQMKLSKALGVPLSDIAPRKMRCSRYFPAVVHGHIVYNASELLDALDENAETCSHCKELAEDLRASFFARFLSSPEITQEKLKNWLKKGIGLFEDKIKRLDPEGFKKLQKAIFDGWVQEDPRGFLKAIAAGRSERVRKLAREVLKKLS